MSLFMFLLLFISCTHNTKSTDIPIKVDFSYVVKPDSQNYVVFTSKIEGSCNWMKWIFPNEEISNKQSITYYFPHKGIYTVKLWIQVNGNTIETSKDISIASDDQNYPSNMLVWSDEFDGDTLNLKNWSYETNVDVNNEWQKYTNGNNISIKNGILTITALKIGPGQNKYDYTSGRINSSGKREFLYGRMEIRASLPSGRGTWPATWMLGSNISSLGWPACGELDIMEHVGYDSLWIQGSIHSPSSYGNTVNFGRLKIDDCESNFHNYGMNWWNDRIEYYVDDPENPYYTYKPSDRNSLTWPFDKPCFFILNLAIGGNWGGAHGVDDSIFPVNMKIDYVRVYSNKFYK